MSPSFYETWTVQCVHGHRAPLVQSFADTFVKRSAGGWTVTVAAQLNNKKLLRICQQNAGPQGAELSHPAQGSFRRRH